MTNAAQEPARDDGARRTGRVRGVGALAAGVGRVRWTVMGTLLVPLTLVMSLDRTNMTVAAPVIQKANGFSLTDMSIILTSFWWTYALFQVPGGMLAERFGARRSLTWASTWWSVFSFLTPFGRGLFGLTAIRGLLGVGQAADWPSSVLALRRWFPRTEQSRGNSLLLAGLYLGPIVGTPLTTWIVSMWGWRWSFYIFAIVGLIIAVGWWAMMRDTPREHPWISSAEAAYVEAGQERSTPRAQRWRVFITSPQFWAIGVQYMFLALIQGFFTTWMPTYLVQARHFSLTQMGFGASLPWVAMLVMVFVSSAVTDRVRRTGSAWRAHVPFAVGGFVVGAVFLVLAALSHSRWETIGLLMVSLGAVGVVQVQIWSVCQSLAPRSAATVSGWTNTWGNISSALGPIFTAALVGVGANWSLAMLVLAAAGVLGAACWFFVHPERPLVIPEASQSTASVAAG